MKIANLTQWFRYISIFLAGIKPWSQGPPQIIRVQRLQQLSKDEERRWSKKLKSITKNWNRYSWVPILSIFTYDLYPYIFPKVEEPVRVSITVNQLLEQKEKNQVRERELKEKRAKIKAFQGLPPVSILFMKASHFNKNDLLNVLDFLLLLIHSLIFPELGTCTTRTAHRSSKADGADPTTRASFRQNGWQRRLIKNNLKFISIFVSRALRIYSKKQNKKGVICCTNTCVRK